MPSTGRDSLGVIRWCGPLTVAAVAFDYAVIAQAAMLYGEVVLCCSSRDNEFVIYRSGLAYRKSYRKLHSPRIPVKPGSQIRSMHSISMHCFNMRGCVDTCCTHAAIACQVSHVPDSCWVVQCRVLRDTGGVCPRAVHANHALFE